MNMSLSQIEILKCAIYSVFCKMFLTRQDANQDNPLIFMNYSTLIFIFITLQFKSATILFHFVLQTDTYQHHDWNVWISRTSFVL